MSDPGNPYGNPPPPGHNPYASPPPQNPYGPPQHGPPPAGYGASPYGPQRSGKKTGMAILIGSLLLVGSCGTCAVVGNAMLSDEVCDALENEPVAVEQFGSGMECSMDWTRTMNDERMDFFHYEVVGPKATGMAVIHSEATGPNATEEIVEGSLEVGGERFDLEGDALAGLESLIDELD